MDFTRLQDLSGVKPQKKEIVKETKILLEEPEPISFDKPIDQEKLKSSIIKLFQDSEKDGQVNEKTSLLINGEITVYIDDIDIKKTGFSVNDLALELKNNKDYYKKSLNISEVSEGSEASISDYFVSIEKNAIAIKIYYTAKNVIANEQIRQEQKEEKNITKFLS
jgi:hypothetical protein